MPHHCKLGLAADSPACRQASGSAAGSDDDFEAASDVDSDDEETIAEQEGAEKQQDHAMEISQLEVTETNRLIYCPHGHRNDALSNW